jgi:uncharacterized membrane protein YesL
MKDRLELNLKAAMYTGMVLVGILCVALLVYCYPIIFPITLIGCVAFLIVSTIFLFVRLNLESKGDYR